MGIESIWRKFNVSLVMVLPIFWSMTEDVLSKKSKIKFPLIQLLLEYGLVNTYLYKDGDCEFDGNLYLLLERKKVLDNLEITNSKHWSMATLLVSSKYYSSVEPIDDDMVLVGLKVPKKFHKDISLIEEGRYSEVSYAYKEEIKVKQMSVPLTDNELSLYITTNDLGYAVSVKAKHIKEQIEEFLDVKLDASQEFFQVFKKDRECHTLKVVDSELKIRI